MSLVRTSFNLLTPMFDFVESIKKQAIFKKFIESSDDSQKLCNRLVVANNSDCFHAVDNIIRCCSINSKSSNYRFIESPFRPMKIRELSTNHNGSLLYATDFSRVVVHSTPSDVSRASFFFKPIENHELQDLKSPIIKVVWLNAVLGGKGLVILHSDNTIKVYDLLTSTKPKLVIDLNQYIDESATSISFGSDKNLIGALTLYVATESSKIYAIYPILFEETTVVTTLEHIEMAKSETEDSLKYLVSSFPERDELLVLIESQLALFTYMKSLCKTSDSSRLCSIVISHTSKPILQGPLIDLQMGNIKDIISIGLNKNMSILAAINGDSDDLIIKYLAQLKPLIMVGVEKLNHDIIKEVYNHKQHQRLLANSPQKGTTEIVDIPDHFYAPSKGFGYLDSEDESEVSTDSESSIVLSLSKPKFWNNSFVTMDELAVDILNDCKVNSDRGLSNSNIGDERFLIRSIDKTIIVTPNNWMGLLSNYLIDTDQRLEIFNDYETIDIEVSDSVALIRDDVTFTGSYAIVVPFKTNSTVEVYQIEKPKDLPKQIEYHEDPKPIVVKTRTQDPLVAEIGLLIKDLKTLKAADIKGDDDELQVLSKVNEFSIDAISQISEYSKLLMKITFKVTVDTMELKNQLETYRSNKPVYIDKKESFKRIEELTSRQKTIHTKLITLHTRLIRKIEDIKVSKQLSLSKNEKEWFEEINQITNDKTLAMTIENLENQVKVIKNSLSDGTKENSLNAKDLAYVKRAFEAQKDSFSKLQTTIDHLNEKIGIHS